MSQDDVGRIIKNAENPRALLYLIEDIRLAYDSELSASKFGEKIERLRKFLELSPAEFAERCSISLPTYYRWVQGNKGKPPRHRIEQFKDFLEGNTTPVAAKSAAYESVRPYAELMDRQELCNRQWALKTFLPFRAAKHQIIKQRLTDLLLREANSQFNCIFYAEDELKGSLVSKWAARNSFGLFKQQLFRQNPETLTRVRGWNVDRRDTAFELGLTTLSLGLTILEYDPAKKEKANLPFMDNREVDYLFEIPIALYPADNEQSSFSGDEDIRWVEWPSSRSSLDWSRRKELFEHGILNANTRLPGVKEILATVEEVQAFVALDYPN